MGSTELVDGFTLQLLDKNRLEHSGWGTKHFTELSKAGLTDGEMETTEEERDV